MTAIPPSGQDIRKIDNYLTWPGHLIKKKKFRYVGGKHEFLFAGRP